MNLNSFSQGLLKGAGHMMSVAGAVGVVFGGVYILDCRRFATTNEGIQGCYAFGGAMAGVGAGVSGIRSGGVQEGLWTYNPYLKSPEPTARRRGKSDPVEPEEGGRDS